MSSSTDQWDAPASATGVDFKELNGALIIVRPIGFEEKVPTTFGANDAVRAQVTAVDGDSAGTVWEDVLIFPRVLVSQLRSKIGGQVLGRVGQGVAKSGQSAPWRLNDPDEADKRTASEFVRAQTAMSFSKPAATGTDLPPF